MDSKQWYALGIIINGYSAYMERGKYPVMRVRRANESLTLACQLAFGGKHYDNADGMHTWVLRGDELVEYLVIARGALSEMVSW